MTQPRLDLVLVGVALDTQVHATRGTVHRGHLTVLLVAHDERSSHRTHDITCVLFELADLVHGCITLGTQVYFTFRTMDARRVAAAIWLLRLALDLNAGTESTTKSTRDDVHVTIGMTRELRTSRRIAAIAGVRGVAACHSCGQPHRIRHRSSYCRRQHMSRSRAARTLHRT